VGLGLILWDVPKSLIQFGSYRNVSINALQVNSLTYPFGSLWQEFIRSPLGAKFGTSFFATEFEEKFPFL